MVVIEDSTVARVDALEHDVLVEPFLLFKQLIGQSSTLFLFPIVDEILQTMLVVTTAAVQHFRT